MPPKRPQPTPRRRSGGRATEAEKARARQVAAREAATQRTAQRPRGKKPPRSAWQKAGTAAKWVVWLTLYSVIFLVAAVIGGSYAAVPILPKIEDSSVFKQKNGVVLARDNKTVLRTLRAPTSRRYVRDGDVPQVV